MATDKAQELLQQQRNLAEQLRQYSLQQAQSSYNQGQRALSEQLRQSRLEGQRNRSVLAEQAFMTNRAINAGTQARGLGTSGLKDLALIQSQRAQGGSVNQLQQSQENVQRSATSSRLGLAENLANMRTGAETQYQQNMVQAGERELALDQQKTDTLLQLYQMAIESGGTADINSLASILGMDLSQIPQEQLDAITGAGAVDTSLNDVFEKQRRNMLGNIIDKTNTYLDPTTYIAWAARNLFGDKVNIDDTTGVANLLNRAISGNLQKGTYTFNGQDVRMTPDEAAAKVNQMYQGKQYIGKEITIKADKGGDIKFYFDGKGYTSYNAAVNAINALKSGN